MKEILEAFLTQESARDTHAIIALASSKEQFDTWN